MSSNTYEAPDAELLDAREFSNPHVLRRQLLGMSLGTLLTLIGGVPGLLFVVLGWLVFADAWRSGNYKVQGKRSFLNISPMGWGVATQLFMIVAFPCYVVFRNRLRTREGGNTLFLILTVLGAVLLLVFVAAVIVNAIFPETVW